MLELGLGLGFFVLIVFYIILRRAIAARKNRGEKARDIYPLW